MDNQHNRRPRICGSQRDLCEALREFGIDVSVRTIKRWKDRGMPYYDYKNNGRDGYDVEQVLSWLRIGEPSGRQEWPPTPALQPTHAAERCPRLAAEQRAELKGLLARSVDLLFG